MQIKEYLNEICEQIKYKPVRKEIAKEIEDHINDIKEDLKNSGEDEEKADEQKEYSTSALMDDYILDYSKIIWMLKQKEE